ncbi:ArdC-like ssDNA-binding domain-containing protein [Aliivibrio salmonicida]
MTFKQAKEKGGQVRKGGKGTHIFFYNMIEKERKGL